MSSIAWATRSRRHVEVRLIAITNRNLRQEVEAGRFRRDLFYRISVTALTVPPLRERVEDIDVLVEHFNRRLSMRHNVPMRQFGPGVMAALRALLWPGNVRELRNVIESLLLTGSDELVTLADLPADLSSSPQESPRPIPGAPASPTSLVDAERRTIERALAHEHGNLAGAARRLGISRSTLYRKLGRYGLEAEETALR